MPSRSAKIPPSLKKRAAQIQVVLMDVDGTITDGSVTNHYVVLQDKENTHARFVLVREDLVLKVNYPTADSFGIDYIGPMDDAPGISLALQAP